MGRKRTNRYGEDAKAADSMEESNLPVCLGLPARECTSRWNFHCRRRLEMKETIGNKKYEASPHRVQDAARIYFVV